MKRLGLFLLLGGLAGAEINVVSVYANDVTLRCGDKETSASSMQPVTVEGTGLLARCLQHETDHLGGTVFGDRLSGRVRRKLYGQSEELAHLYPDDWPLTPKRTSADG